jgi:hypothetical protein
MHTSARINVHRFPVERRCCLPDAFGMFPVRDAARSLTRFGDDLRAREMSAEVVMSTLQAGGFLTRLFGCIPTPRSISDERSSGVFIIVEYAMALVVHS